MRFANTNVWDSNTGYNNLNATIVIDRNAPMNPGELPEGVETISDEGLGISGPQKVIQDGIFYILMPDGKKHYCL